MMIIDPVTLGDGGFSRASPASYFDSKGVLRVAPADQFRIGYDPANLAAPPAAMVEAAATNLHTYPRNFDNPAWGKINVIAAPFQALALDGTMSAYKLVESAVNGGHYIEQAPAIVGAETYARKWIVKEAGKQFIRLDVHSYPTISISATVAFNFVTGTFQSPVVTGGAQQSYQARALADGWWELTQIVSLGSVDRQCFSRLTLMGANGVTLYAGDGISGVLASFAQMELGNVSTSPIPDATAFVSRASAKWEFDAAGVLRSYAANVPAVAYDPISHIPRGISLEQGVTNVNRNNMMTGGAVGMPGTLPTFMGIAPLPDGINRTVAELSSVRGIEYVALRFQGVAATNGNASIFADNLAVIAAANGDIWTASMFVKLAAGLAPVMPSIVIDEYVGSTWLTGGSKQIAIAGPEVDLAACRCEHTRLFSGGAGVSAVRSYLNFPLPAGATVDFTVIVGLPQLEKWPYASSPVKTNGAAAARAADIVSSPQASRAADIITSGPALLYSNVPITEPTYSADATYAKGVNVLDPSTHLVYESLVDANKGSALSDVTKWLAKGATSRWAMFDQYNNTQTSNADEIIFTMSPQQISQGLYLGNIDANDVTFVVQDIQRGVVYVEKQSLIIPTSKSSFFRWCFGRIRRRSYAVTPMLPVYANALVTVIIKKPGSVPRCGMCAIGPLVDVGLSQYGLSAEIKDYSSTTFNFDGTSKTVERGYSKRMSVDVEIDDDQVDAVHEALIAFRQKPVVYLGSVLHGLACVFGKYSSFKVIVESKPLSKASLQIEGTV